MSLNRTRSQFVCQQCQYSSPKWLGKCPECGTWNSLVEEASATPVRTANSRATGTPAEARSILQVDDAARSRIALPMAELDHVLGGGLTQGSVVLLAGDPGIGKSTLLLQLLGGVARTNKGPFLYVSGEESARQIKLRGERLGALRENLLVLPSTNAVDVLTQMERLRPEIAVIDSIQTLYWPELASIPGSVSQVREVADRLVRFAKESNVTLLLVGHVTKEGSIAGPMALEHLVDTILLFEGDRGQPFRILRAIKNRFGPTDEVGVFDMREEGLSEVANPSELFLRDRPTRTPGTIVFPAMEGSRPFLVEVQALATRSTYGLPLRTCSGFDKNRLTMLLAVLEKRAGLRLSDQDVYVNVVGGLRLAEPAADLPIALAVVGSFLGRVFPPQGIAFGEVGLAGEVRATARGEARLKEARKLGFTFAVTPRDLQNSEMECRAVRSVDELVDLFISTT